MNQQLTGPALALGNLMSDISEDVYAAGWIQNNEWILWRALLDWRKDGRAYWAPGTQHAHDITEYMPELDRLQRESGGWVWWLDGMTFVPETRWLALVQRRRDQAAAVPDNAELHRALPPLQFVPKCSTGEPLCCDKPMVHNSFTGQWECADAYFELLDSGVLSESIPDRSDTAAMDDHQRERFEHWLTNRIDDGCA
ncbi:hypothetical protein ACIBTV_25500 [Micromonospora sp. NPDC049366]|uniref:hypothetical protein n=1 Tax=Micromonospora sp. NPDC049366 TaxID=3364271 RepID=UPI003790656B